jgi:quercetin dioxygenase-like cupin family protein
LSRTLHSDERVKVVLFGFAAGEELSAHTAPSPAILQFVSGRGTLQLGKGTLEFGPGSFAHMPAHLPHSIAAATPTVMLLLLIKQPASPAVISNP